MDFTAKQIAKRRISILIQRAKDAYQENPVLAQNYIKTAKRLAMASKLHLPVEFKRQFCKKCFIFLVPGETSRVRIRPTRETHLITTCLNCGYQNRYPIKPRIKKEIEQVE